VTQVYMQPQSSGADPGFLISWGADLEQVLEVTKKVKQIWFSHQHPPPLEDFRCGASGFLGFLRGEQNMVVKSSKNTVQSLSLAQHRDS